MNLSSRHIFSHTSCCLENGWVGPIRGANEKQCQPIFSLPKLWLTGHTNWCPAYWFSQPYFSYINFGWHFMIPKAKLSATIQTNLVGWILSNTVKPTVRADGTFSQFTRCTFNHIFYLFFINLKNIKTSFFSWNVQKNVDIIIIILFIKCHSYISPKWCTNKENVAHTQVKIYS